MSTKPNNWYDTHRESVTLPYREAPKAKGTSFDLHRESLTVPYQEAADITVVHEETGRAFPDLSKTNSVDIPSDEPEETEQLQDFLLKLKQEIAELEKALTSIE